MKNPCKCFILIASFLYSIFVVQINVVFASRPMDQVKMSIDDLLVILTDEELRKPEQSKERREAIRKLAEKNFDFEEMAKRSLARHWHGRTPQEKKEFVSLYYSLLWNTYIDIVEKYQDEEIEYLGEEIRGKYSEVRTKIITANAEVELDFRLLRRGNTWMAYDVIVEGVSLIRNYRSQFNHIMTSGSYEKLVERLKSKQVRKRPSLVHH